MFGPSKLSHLLATKAGLLFKIIFGNSLVEENGKIRLLGLCLECLLAYSCSVDVIFSVLESRLINQTINVAVVTIYFFDSLVECIHFFCAWQSTTLTILKPVLLLLENSHPQTMSGPSA